MNTLNHHPWLNAENLEYLKDKLTWAGVVLLILLLWRGFTLPSDAQMLRNFAQHQTKFEEMVQMMQEEDQYVMVGRTKTWFSKYQIESSRVATYRKAVWQLGISNIIGNSEAVGFQRFITLLPLGPAKSYVYSTSTPQTLTTGQTDDYQFVPSERRQVCRHIEEDWYLCIDYED